MPTYDFIYFDLDDTLLDHRHAERAALTDLVQAHATLFGRHSLDTVHTTYHAINRTLWPRFTAGTLTKAALKQERFAQLLDRLGIAELDARAASDEYMDRYSAHWVFTSGAEAVFHRVADTYRTGVLTNGFSEVQRAKLQRFPALAERSEAIVISEEVGPMKPDPKIFTHAANLAGVPPERILYVGDSVRSDVEGGTGSGWDVAWFAPDAATEEAPTATVHLRDWEALLTYLNLGGQGPKTRKAAL